MQGSLTLASGASGTDDEYNGMTITTGGDVVATGVITDYDGTAKTIVVTWSACTETGSPVCDDTDGVTPTTTPSTTYVISPPGACSFENNMEYDPDAANLYCEGSTCNIPSSDNDKRTCCKCEIGYTGDNCNRCDVGYTDAAEGSNPVLCVSNLCRPSVVETGKKTREDVVCDQSGYYGMNDSGFGYARGDPSLNDEFKPVNYKDCSGQGEETCGKMTNKPSNVDRGNNPTQYRAKCCEPINDLCFGNTDQSDNSAYPDFDCEKNLDTNEYGRANPIAFKEEKKRGIRQRSHSDQFNRCCIPKKCDGNAQRNCTYPDNNGRSVACTGYDVILDGQFTDYIDIHNEVVDPATQTTSYPSDFTDDNVNCTGALKLKINNNGPAHHTSDADEDNFGCCIRKTCKDIYDGNTATIGNACENDMFVRYDQGGNLESITPASDPGPSPTAPGMFIGSNCCRPCPSNDQYKKDDLPGTLSCESIENRNLTTWQQQNIYGGLSTRLIEALELVFDRGLDDIEANIDEVNDSVPSFSNIPVEIRTIIDEVFGDTAIVDNPQEISDILFHVFFYEYIKFAVSDGTFPVDSSFQGNWVITATPAQNRVFNFLKTKLIARYNVNCTRSVDDYLGKYILYVIEIQSQLQEIKIKFPCELMNDIPDNDPYTLDHGLDGITNAVSNKSSHPEFRRKLTDAAVKHFCRTGTTELVLSDCSPAPPPAPPPASSPATAPAPAPASPSAPAPIPTPAPREARTEFRFQQGSGSNTQPVFMSSPFNLIGRFTNINEGYSNDPHSYTWRCGDYGQCSIYQDNDPNDLTGIGNCINGEGGTAEFTDYNGPADNNTKYGTGSFDHLLLVKSLLDYSHDPKMLCRAYGCNISDLYANGMQRIMMAHTDKYPEYTDSNGNLTREYFERDIGNPDIRRDFQGDTDGYDTVLNDIYIKMKENCKNRTIHSDLDTDIKKKSACLGFGGYDFRGNDVFTSLSHYSDFRDNMCIWNDDTQKCDAKGMGGDTRYDLLDIFKVPYLSKCDVGFAGHPMFGSEDGGRGFCLGESSEFLSDGAAKNQPISFLGCSPITKCSGHKYATQDNNTYSCINQNTSETIFLIEETQEDDNGMITTSDNFSLKKEHSEYPGGNVLPLHPSEIGSCANINHREACRKNPEHCIVWEWTTDVKCNSCISDSEKGCKGYSDEEICVKPVEDPNSFEYVRSCSIPEEGYYLIDGYDDNGDNRGKTITKECPIDHGTSIYAGEGDICIPCKSIPGNEDKPYRNQGMDNCGGCPISGPGIPPPQPFDGKCSTNCGYIYNSESQECIKCEEGHEPSLDGSECIECLPSYNSIDGIKCIQNQLCENGNWVCNNCSMQWQFNNNNELSSVIDESEINRSCCSNNQQCNFINVHQGDYDNRPLPNPNICPDYCESESCIYNENHEIPCNANCLINNGGSEVIQASGNGEPCKSDNEFCKPENGIQKGDCCESWPYYSNIQNYVLENDECIKIATCMNGIEVNANDYREIPTSSNSVKEFVHIINSEDKFKISNDRIKYNGDIPEKLYAPVKDNWCDTSTYSIYSTLKNKEEIYNNALNFNINEDNSYLNEIKNYYQGRTNEKTPSELLDNLDLNEGYKCRKDNTEYNYICESGIDKDTCCYRNKDQCYNFNCNISPGWISKPGYSNHECLGEVCDIFDLQTCCYNPQDLTCSSMDCGIDHVRKEGEESLNKSCIIDFSTNTCDIFNENNIRECCDPKERCMDAGEEPNSGSEPYICGDGQAILNRTCRNKECDENDFSSTGLCCIEKETCMEGLRRLDITTSCSDNYHFDRESYCSEQECTENDMKDMGECCLLNQMCKDKHSNENCPEDYQPRNEYEICNSSDCSSYEDLELCCSRNQTCGSLEENSCNIHPGYINDPLSYNISCKGEVCDIIGNLEDKGVCCKKGCEPGKFLENEVCYDCQRIENSKSDADIICTTRYNSRFKDLDEDNCISGYNPIRTDNFDICGEIQTCSNSNICDNFYGYKTISDDSAASLPASLENCCEPDDGYKHCIEGEEDCINGVKCVNGRVRRNIRGVESCVADRSKNFEMCDDSEDCTGDLKCLPGFFLDEGRCIVDTEKNFICDDINELDGECLSGNIRCRGGYNYNENTRECIPGRNIVGDSLDCAPGKTHNEFGDCIFEKIRNGTPTNFVFENKQLSCKKGYKLEEDSDGQPFCVLDTEKNWTCRRGGHMNNDGNKCCDPITIGETIKCISKPECKANHINIEDECVSKNTNISIDCEGEWSPCLNDCKDRTFTITRKREGKGEPCKDENNTLLKSGDKKSCKGLGSCTLYENKLCGANLSNVIIEDEDKWIWRWNNQTTRDRCDRFYTGDRKGCRNLQIGDARTREYCDIYTNKCMGNTNPAEDINCYGIDKIPKENSYSLDKVGDGIDSCCEDFNVVQLISRKEEKFSEKDKKLREIFKMRNDNRSKEINKLLR